jgi:hypothetical protein
MPYPLFPSNIRVIASADEIERVHVRADPGPPPVAGGRPKGSKRLHTNATVAAARA